VTIARNAAEGIGHAAERRVMFISENDGALGFSGWLFGGITRLGSAHLKTIFTPEQMAMLRTTDKTQIIEAKITKIDLGHSYFYQHPGVSSDLMLLMRYQLPPGAAHGRPLIVSDDAPWVINDPYPGPDWAPEQSRLTQPSP